MQKISIAIVLALTLSCVVAVDYAPIAAGWVKPPVSICNDTEYLCTNTSTISLVGLTSSDVNIAAYNASVPVKAENTSSATWSVYTKAIVTKDLSAPANTTYAYKADQFSTIAFGVAIAITSANESSPQLYLYQTKVNGAVEYPRVQITNNTVANYTPMFAGLALSSKTIFIFYYVADKKVNATSVAITTSTLGKEVTISTAITSGVQAATGEAISANQVYAAWNEGETTFKVSIVDFSSAALTNTATLGKWDKSYTCAPYVTDKKYYGAVCQATVNETTTVYVSANSTDLLPMFTTFVTNRTFTSKMVAYGPYMAFFYRNGAVANATVLSYDIWDVEGFKAFKNGTDFLTIDSDKSTGTGMAQYRIPQGGLYYVAYNMRVNSTQTNTKVVVGLLLGSSYLTSVFGFLLTIIAGLFLF